MAPSNGTTPTPPKLVVTFPPNHSTLQWHPRMAPSNGSTSTPLKLVVTFPPNHSTLQWHPTMAPSSGTTSTAPCNGTLVPRPIRQSGSSPSPLIGSKNPYSYRYLGKKPSGPLPPQSKSPFFGAPSHPVTSPRCITLQGSQLRYIPGNGRFCCGSCSTSTGFSQIIRQLISMDTHVPSEGI